MGRQYVEGRSIEFEVSYQESGPATPMFFVLSPGVDPLKDVEALGKKLGFTFDAMNFHNVSLGQVRVLYNAVYPGGRYEGYCAIHYAFTICSVQCVGAGVCHFNCLLAHV